MFSFSSLFALLKSTNVFYNSSNRDELMLKGIQALHSILLTKNNELSHYADSLLEVLLFAKNKVLQQNIADLSFLSRINLPNIRNKTIKYSKFSSNSSLMNRGCSGQSPRFIVLFHSFLSAPPLFLAHHFHRQSLRHFCFFKRHFANFQSLLRHSIVFDFCPQWRVQSALRVHDREQ